MRRLHGSFSTARRRSDGLALGAAVRSAFCCRSRPGRCCSRRSGTRTTARSPCLGGADACCRWRSFTAPRPRWRPFVHAMLAEYLSFIVLLFALYTVAGGILITGNLRGTPVDQCRHRSRFGTVHRELRRHHRRRHDPDPPADPRQRRARGTTSTSSSSSSSWSPISAARSRRSAIRRCSSASCAASISSGPRSICGCRP